MFCQKTFKPSRPNFCLQGIRMLEKRSQRVPRRDNQMRQPPWALHKSQCWGQQWRGGGHRHPKVKVIKDAHHHLQCFHLDGIPGCFFWRTETIKRPSRDNMTTHQTAATSAVSRSPQELLLTTASCFVTSPPRHTPPCSEAHGNTPTNHSVRGTRRPSLDNTDLQCVLCDGTSFWKAQAGHSAIFCSLLTC